MDLFVEIERSSNGDSSEIDEIQAFDPNRKGSITKRPLKGIIIHHVPCGAEDQEKVFLEWSKTQNCPVCKKRVLDSDIVRFQIEEC